MPSESRRQHRTMEAAAHDKEFAEKLGIPQNVAREYVDADERNKQWKKRDRVRKAALLSACAVIDSLYFSGR